ncbi:hypothetical protein [Candidatus Binatus sp.]|uniref:hypothetical protein n=1 Tax=Candidatus Binatus sp. TaxID=2811406 RepID=UPI003BBA7717
MDGTLSGDHCRIVASAAQQGLKPARPHPDQTLRGEAVSMDFMARVEKFLAEYSAGCPQSSLSVHPQICVTHRA